MRKLGIGAIIAITALVTALVTSLIWVLAYNLATEAPPAAPPVAAEAGEVVTPHSEPQPGAPLIASTSDLVVPVAGVKAADLVDTYSQARAGGTRSHDAIDIMAPHGTDVVAAADGMVEKLFFSKGGGGLTIYVRSPNRQWIHYYAHLQAYAPGLAEGQTVRRGARIGTVGSSGNADPSGPHLHFAVLRMREGEDWHEGEPVNPYPLLAGTGRPR